MRLLYIRLRSVKGFWLYWSRRASTLDNIPIRYVWGIWPARRAKNLVAHYLRLVLENRITYSQMAMQRGLNLDRTFRALADGTRRSMIHALARGQTRSAGELGRQFRSAQPNISN